jgi:virulence-associated protein VapD
MGKFKKLKQKIINGKSDNNINFSDLRQLLKQIGFSEKIKGDHYIFTKEEIPEIINIQPLKTQAKSYQVKQIRNLIIKYNLGGENVD